MTRTRLTAEPLEPRDNPAAIDLTTVGPPLDVPTPLFAVGADASGGPHVRVFTAEGRELFSFMAFDPTFTGGVRVATADFTGDGFEDVAIGAGVGGGPHVRVFDGRTGALVMDTFVFEPTFRGGVFLGAGDAATGGPADLLVGAGPGGAPRVLVFNAATGARTQDFFAGDPNFRGGAAVSGGDLNADGVSDLVVGTGRFNPTSLTSFDGRTLQPFGTVTGSNGTGLAGASVADLDGNGDADLLASQFPTAGGLLAFDDALGATNAGLDVFGRTGTSSAGLFGLAGTQGSNVGASGSQTGILGLSSAQAGGLRFGATTSAAGAFGTTPAGGLASGLSSGLPGGASGLSNGFRADGLSAFSGGLPGGTSGLASGLPAGSGLATPFTGATTGLSSGLQVGASGLSGGLSSQPFALNTGGFNTGAAGGTTTGGTGAAIVGPGSTAGGTTAAGSSSLRSFGTDLNSDGVADVIFGTGPGVASTLVVVDGATGRTLFQTNAFPGFRGGVTIG